MGLFTFVFAGGSFMLVGAWESFSSHSQTPPVSSPSPLSSLNKITALIPPMGLSAPISTNNHKPRFSNITLISTAVLSLLFFFNSLLSIRDALHHNDRIGTALQLQVLAVSSLFLILSVTGLSTNLTKAATFPYILVDLILLFAFVQEFLLFYLQKKDPSGIENRYFDLMLVPITICIFSTIIELKSPSWSAPKLARGIGLILKGTWFIQMGLSFYTDSMAHNCHLIEKSRGNYTIWCKGHMDFHRARAIAVLLFNCHLAFLVAVISGVYSFVGRRYFGVIDYSRYRSLGAGSEVQARDDQMKFTLDSYEDDDSDGINVVKEEGRIATRDGGNGEVEMGVNAASAH